MARVSAVPVVGELWKGFLMLALTVRDGEAVFIGTDILVTPIQGEGEDAPVLAVHAPGRRVEWQDDGSLSIDHRIVVRFGEKPERLLFDAPDEFSIQREALRSRRKQQDSPPR